MKAIFFTNCIKISEIQKRIFGFKLESYQMGIKRYSLLIDDLLGKLNQPIIGNLW